MNWDAIRAIETAVLAVASLGNLVVLLQIDKRIAQAIDRLKDWSRDEFITQREADKRFEALERR